MEIFLNKKKSLMFHEVLDDLTINSGWHLSSKGRYTISTQKLKEIINYYGDSVNYTFDDGGISNLVASVELEKSNIKGIFFIATHYIGKPGFLNINQLKSLSKNHYVFAHGHEHLMNNFDYDKLKNDWKISLKFMETHGLSKKTICLPGGTFSRNHNIIFNELSIENIFHSAPNNYLINFLYGKTINFLPRFVVDKDFKKINEFSLSSFKSITKQLINYFK